MGQEILSLIVSKRRVLTLFASLLIGMALLFGLGMRTAETQTTPYYYEVQDLGTLPGGSNSVPYDINDSGHVVGCADTESGQQHAFLYKDGELKDLDTLGGNTSCAHGVNNSGQVVGSSDTASGETHAFLYDSTNEMKDLGTLGGTNSYASDINNSGQVVGSSDTASGETHAFIWKDDGNESTTDMKDPSVPEGPWLGTWPWGTYSYADAINDSGQVVGQTKDHAFLYNIDTKKVKDLGTLPGGCCSEAYGINASGQVVGWSYYGGNIYHAFLYGGEGPMQDLGDLVTSGESGYSWAWDINDSGEVVGFSDNDYYSPTPGTAFLYRNGEMIDLNSRLISDNDGSVWNLYWALGINNDGQIVVDGWQNGGQDHALLLTPSDVRPPPDTTIDRRPTGTVASDSATFEFHATEEGSTFECSLDGGGWTKCTSPTSYDDLADGEHTLKVRATDAATGTTDPTPASSSWTVDTADPDTTIGSTKPANPTNSASASFSFSSSESDSTFKCKLDNGGYEDCSSTKQYPGLAQGSHTFSVKAIDQAGNEDETPASYTWTIDTTAPTVGSVTPSGSGTGVSRTTTVTATFSEAMDPTTLTTSTVTLVKVGFLGSTTPVTATVTLGSDGKTVTLKPSSSLAASTKYTATIKGGTSGAKDTAGNPLASDKVWSFTTGTSAGDATPPETTINSGPSGTVNSSSASFSFSSSESGSRFECRLDGGSSWSACTSPKEYTGLSNGNHTFEVRATDSAGNTDSTPASRTWTIDTTSTPPGDKTAPTVSSTSPTDRASSVARTTSVTATFSEALDPATVTKDTFTLVRDGTTTPITATVTLSSDGKTATLKPSASLGSSTKYKATVKGGAANCTSCVKDKAGNPLATDNVWTFTTSFF